MEKKNLTKKISFFALNVFNTAIKKNNFTNFLALYNLLQAIISIMGI